MKIQNKIKCRWRGVAFAMPSSLLVVLLFIYLSLSVVISTEFSAY